MAKQKREKFMDSVVTKSPRGVAIWVHVKEPDEFQGQLKYKLTQKLPKEGAENQEQIDAFIEQIRELEEKAYTTAGKGFAQGTLAVKDGDEREWKGEGDNPYADHWLLTFSSKYQPKVVNIKGAPVAADVWPAGGDIVRVGVELVPYAAKARGIGVGVSLRMLGVQIIEKRARGFDDWADESGDGGDDVPGGDETGGDDPDL